MVKRRDCSSDAGLPADSRDDTDADDGTDACAIVRDTASAAEGIGRRSYLKLLGVSALPAAATSARASETGYGQGGYGEGGYGGDEETVDPVVTVETDPATDVTDSSATLHGTVTELSGVESVDVYFEYRDGSSSTWTTTGTQQLADAGSFSAGIDGLESDTGYEYRAVAEADAESDVGETLTFSTDEDQTSALSVATDTATNVSDTSATLNGTVTELTNIDAVDVHFEYREAGSNTWTTTDSQRLTAEESFSKDVTGLASERTYEYRAVAESDEDGDTGELVEFTTDEPEIAAEPAIDRFEAADTSPPNPHVELDVDWAVSHDDGALEAVQITVRDGAGAVIDRAETAVSGSRASGSESFKIKHGVDETYSVTLIVTDQANQTTEAERTVS